MTDTDADIEPAPVPSADRTSVSVLGTGMLGAALARALLRAGHRVTVWNRTPAKADALVAEGAFGSATAAEAVGASRIVVPVVSTYDDVQAVLDSAPAEPAEPADLAGRTLVNLSSGIPEQARAMAAWAAERGAAYLDGAAMSGTRLVGRPDALFLFSGEADAFAAAQGALGSLGRAVYLGSDPGAASLYDTALLTVNMGLLTGFYHAVALVRAAGADAPDFAAVATEYLPFAAGLLADHARQIHDGRYSDDDGTLDVYAAAMHHVVDTSRQQGIGVEIPAAIEALLERAITAGHARDGLPRLADVIARGPAGG